MQYFEGKKNNNMPKLHMSYTSLVTHYIVPFCICNTCIKKQTPPKMFPFALIYILKLEKNGCLIAFQLSTGHVTFSSNEDVQVILVIKKLGYFCKLLCDMQSNLYRILYIPDAHLDNSQLRKK